MAEAAKHTDPGQWSKAACTKSQKNCSEKQVWELGRDRRASTRIPPGGQVNNLESEERHWRFSGEKESCKILRTDVANKQLSFKLFEVIQREKQI